MSTAELSKQHPAWCSPKHCSVTDDGERVHEQAPVRWEDHDAAVRVESQLLDPADDEDTYVQLSLENRLLTWVHYHGILPLEVAQRLRDQLSEHLDAAGWCPVSEHPDPEGGIHLLLADDAVTEGNRGRRYLTLCGELVPLVSALCPAGCDREHYLCQECVHEATQWGADAVAGQAKVAPDAGSTTSPGEDASSPPPDDKRGNFLITECGHPRRIRANGGVIECRLCDPRRPPVPELRLHATELYSIDVTASVDTVSWWCRLCDLEETVANVPAADTAAIEHIAAQHSAVVDPT